MGRLISPQTIVTARGVFAQLRSDVATILSGELVKQPDGSTKPMSADHAVTDVPCRVDPLDSRTRRLFGDGELLDQASHSLSFDVDVHVAAGDTVIVGERAYLIMGTDAGRSDSFLLTALGKESGVPL